MTDKIVLVICLALGGLTLWWLADVAYLSPLRDVNLRVATLAIQQVDLGKRKIALEADLGSTGAAPDIEGLVFSDGDIGSAAAKFQESVRAMVQQNGGMAISSQSINTDLGGGYTRLSVLVRARFAEMGLLNFLRMAESALPVVTVDALQVFSMPIAGDPLPLDLTATLSGFHANAAAP